LYIYPQNSDSKFEDSVIIVDVYVYFLSELRHTVTPNIAKYAVYLVTRFTPGLINKRSVDRRSKITCVDQSLPI